ncbi:MAG: transporter substrate-binding domain-containing protein [Rhodoferax sp.]|nr:transporter substrate-binding domain-containing protein [Rhodoferax sp.]
MALGKWLVSSVLWCGLALAFQSAGAAPLKVGALHLPPFYVLDATQTHVEGGTTIVCIKKVLERAKVDYALFGFPAKRLYENFASGAIDMVLGSTGNSVIADKGLLGPLPLRNSTIELYSLLPTSKIPTSIAELDGKSVITIAGYSYAGLLDELKNTKADLVPSPTHDSAMLMLGAGRAPYALVYRGVVDDSVKLAKLEGKINSRVMKTLQILVQINKETPNAQETMDKVMKALKEVKAQGQCTDTYKK